jgi:hypothetical protein
MLVGLVFFNDAPSCIEGNVARGRASHARQVFGEKPDEEATYQSYDCWRLGVGPTTVPCKTQIVSKPQEKEEAMTRIRAEAL